MGGGERGLPPTHILAHSALLGAIDKFTFDITQGIGSDPKR